MPPTRLLRPASNFLAQYLQDSVPSLKPVVIHLQTTAEFRERVVIGLTGKSCCSSKPSIP
ncbi:TPA: hypothetical protein ACTAOO_004160 [Salmonella enterica subsp. enterica]